MSEFLVLRQDKSSKISCALKKDHLAVWVLDKETDRYYKCILVYNDELPKMIREQIDDIKELYDYLRKNPDNIAFIERFVIIRFEFGLSKKMKEQKIQLYQLQSIPQQILKNEVRLMRLHNLELQERVRLNARQLQRMQIENSELHLVNNDLRESKSIYQEKCISLSNQLENVKEQLYQNKIRIKQLERDIEIEKQSTSNYKKYYLEQKKLQNQQKKIINEKDKVIKTLESYNILAEKNNDRLERQLQKFRELKANSITKEHCIANLKSISTQSDQICRNDSQFQYEKLKEQKLSLHSQQNIQIKKQKIISCKELSQVKEQTQEESLISLYTNGQRLNNHQRRIYDKNSISRSSSQRKILDLKFKKGHQFQQVEIKFNFSDFQKQQLKILEKDGVFKALPNKKITVLNGQFPIINSGKQVFEIQIIKSEDKDVFIGLTSSKKDMSDENKIFIRSDGAISYCGRHINFNNQKKLSSSSLVQFHIDFLMEKVKICVNSRQLQSLSFPQNFKYRSLYYFVKLMGKSIIKVI